MGRKNWKETTSQRGPGRKAKKQGDPRLPPQLSGDVGKVNSEGVGGRIKQRARKRASKAALQQAIKQGPKKVKRAVEKKYSAVQPPPKQDSSPPVSETDDTPLEPTVPNTKQRLELFNDRSDGNSGKDWW